MKWVDTTFQSFYALNSIDFRSLTEDRMRFKMAVGFAVALLIIIFTMQNVDVVSLRFLFWELAVPQALLIFVVFSAGLFGGYLLRSLAAGSRRKKSKEPAKQVNP